MSVSLGIYKGEPFDCSSSECIDMIPVSVHVECVVLMSRDKA